MVPTITISKSSTDGRCPLLTKEGQAPEWEVFDQEIAKEGSDESLSLVNRSSFNYVDGELTATVVKRFSTNTTLWNSTTTKFKKSWISSKILSIFSLGMV